MESINIKNILYELDARKCAYDLDGVEITEEDAKQVQVFMKDGASFEEAIDAVLNGIRDVISEGWEF